MKLLISLTLACLMVRGSGLRQYAGGQLRLTVRVLGRAQVPARTAAEAERVAGLIFELSPSVVLVTDAIDAAGVGDGRFELGGQEVLVHDGEARLTATGSLAGSTLTMDEALRNAVHVSGVSIERASAATSLMPARALGLEQELGSIAPGRRADLLVLDDDLNVTGVMANGRWCAN